MYDQIYAFIVSMVSHVISFKGSITHATPSSTPSSASTPASQTPSSGPTTPQEGTKTVIIEVKLDEEFLNEYNDINSPEYKNLETALKTNLTKVYQNVDGFVDVRILLITEGSVICNYVVILAKSSAVTEDKLKDILLNAGKETFPFKVQSVTLVRTEKPPKETLPQWALVTMIVLGVLAFVFIVVAICACVSIVRSHFLLTKYEYTETRMYSKAILGELLRPRLLQVFVFRCFRVCGTTLKPNGKFSGINIWAQQRQRRNRTP